MGENASKAIGAQGKVDCHMLLPEQLTIIEDDPKHPCHDGLAVTPPSQEAIENIIEFGVLEPIRARRAGKGDNGKPILEVIFGRDRIRLVAAANKILAKARKPLLRLPTIISRGDDKKVFGMVLSENTHRKVLSPLTKAKQAERYHEYGATAAEVCREMRCSPATLRNYRALLECCSEVQKAIDKGMLSVEAALILSKLSHKDQKVKLAEMIAAGATKGQKAKEAAQNAVDGGSATPTTTSRMRSRKFLETWRDGLDCIKDNEEVSLAANLIRFMLGEDTALKQLPETVRAVLREMKA